MNCPYCGRPLEIVRSGGKVLAMCYSCDSVFELKYAPGITVEKESTGIGDKVIIIRGDESVTKIVHYKGEIKSARFYHSKKRGALKEFSFVSDSPKFKMLILQDGKEIFNESFEGLKELSPYVPSLSAFEDNGKHVVTITDIKWQKEGKITITPLDKINCLLWIKIEEYL